MAQTLPSPTPVADGARLWTVAEYERLPGDLFPEGNRVELFEGRLRRKHTGELRPWSLVEYERIPEGVFPEGVRVELIDGQIYEKMSQNDPHIHAMRGVFAALLEAFGPGFILSMQLPLKVGPGNAPEPDVAVLRGGWREHERRDLDAPRDVALVVAVSDSSLARDRGPKARLYARFGIPECWIVNLRDRMIEVRSAPDPESESYVVATLYREGESVALAGGTVAVADVLPRTAG